MIIKPKYYGPQIPSTYAVNMTAAASGSNGITVADDDDIDFGTGDFFLHWEGSLPDWTPSTFELIRKTPSSADSGYALYIDSSPVGRLLLSLVNGGVAELQINSTVATGVADGGVAKITVVVVRETASVAGSATFYLNGAILGTAVAITAGTPYSISNALSMYVSGSATRRTASNTISCIVGNFAPTAAEVLDLCTNGIPASWKWGSQTTAYISDFSAGEDGWTGASMTVVGNIDGIDGLNNVLRGTVDSTGAGRRILKTYAINLGKRYAIDVSINFPAANVSADSFIITNQSGDILASGVSASNVTKGAWTTFNFEFTAAVSATSVRIYIGGTNSTGSTTTIGDIIYISQMDIKQTGATMALLPNSIPTSGATAWDDSSGNTGGGTLPAAGATKVTIRK